MKKTLTLFLLLSIFTSASSQVIDTTGGRYFNPIFPGNPAISSGITFGTYNTSVMDIYEPAGDNLDKRPLIVFAHGGSFIGGSKTDGDIVELCKRFAKMGYVTASINYRLGIFPVDSTNATKAVVKAVQDMRAAIRYFRIPANATTYRIHPDYVFSGGSSAGAFMALHTAYLDKESEVPPSINIASLGGLEGNAGGNAGYSSKVNAAINLCGALKDSTWMEPGDVPVVSLHGNVDQTVPYNTAIISVYGIPLVRVDGSASLKIRANNVGVDNPIHTYWGQGHVPYGGNSPTNVAYMDTTVDFVKVFLRPLLVKPSSTGTTSINDNNKETGISIFPNPSSGDVFVRFSNPIAKTQTIEMVDVSGRMVRKMNATEQDATIKRESLNAGIYLLKIWSEDKPLLVEKVVLY